MELTALTTLTLALNVDIWRFLPSKLPVLLNRGGISPPGGVSLPLLLAIVTVIRLDGMDNL